MKKLLLVFAIFATPALAQQPQQNPLEARIAAQIGNLTIQNNALAIQVEQLQAELAKVKAELEAAKKEPAK